MARVATDPVSWLWNTSPGDASLSPLENGPSGMIVRLLRKVTDRAESQVHSRAAITQHGGATKRLWVFGIGLLAIVSLPIALHAQEQEDTLQVAAEDSLPAETVPPPNSVQGEL